MPSRKDVQFFRRRLCCPWVRSFLSGFVSAHDWSMSCEFQQQFIPGTLHLPALLPIKTPDWKSVPPSIPALLLSICSSLCSLLWWPFLKSPEHPLLKSGVGNVGFKSHSFFQGIALSEMFKHPANPIIIQDWVGFRQNSSCLAAGHTAWWSILLLKVFNSKKKVIMVSCEDFNYYYPDSTILSE